MGALLPLIAIILSTSQMAESTKMPKEADALSISGEWHGVLSPTPGSSIPLILRIAGTPGKWTATLDSPAQGANGLVIKSVITMPPKFRFILAAPAAEFEATLAADGKALSGTWTQGGTAIPLVMSLRF